MIRRQTASRIITFLTLVLLGTVKSAVCFEMKTVVNINFYTTLTTDIAHNPLKSVSVTQFSFADQLYLRMDDLKLNHGKPIDAFAVQSIGFAAPYISPAAPFRVDISFGYRTSIDGATTTLIWADNVPLVQLVSGTCTLNQTAQFPAFSDAVEADILADSGSRSFESVYFVLELDFEPTISGEDLRSQGMENINLDMEMSTRLNSHENITILD